jgi:hypothetical protein
MRDKSRKLTQEDVDSFLSEFTTREAALKFLQEAGFIDENGDLTPPYRPPSELK